jgi:hypothetical protein
VGRLGVRKVGLSRLTFLSVSLLFLTFAVSSVHAYAAGIYVSGINPAVASIGDAVHVYGGGATPRATVVAMLSGPEIVLLNQSGTVVPFNGSFIYVPYNTYPIYTLNNTTNTFIVGLSQYNMTLGWAIATPSGTWDINFVTPNVTPGIYDVYVLDNSTFTSDVVRFQVSTNVIKPSLFTIDYVRPSSGSTGTTVVVSGSGASGDGIRIYFDDMMVTSLNGYYQGSWSASFQVPSTSAGIHILRAVDVASGVIATIQFTVTPSIIVMSFSVPIMLIFIVAGAIFSGVTTLVILFCFWKEQK